MKERHFLLTSKEQFLKELFRKSIHMCAALVPLLLKFCYWPVIVLLVLAALIYTISELLRIRGKSFPLVTLITKTASRNTDEKRFEKGPLTLVAGILLVALLFEWKTATVGIFALAFGDGSASLIGRNFGRVKLPFTGGKTLEGSAACFVFVLLSVGLFTGNWWLSASLALFTAFIEVMPLSYLDNLVIPFSVSTAYIILLS